MEEKYRKAYHHKHTNYLHVNYIFTFNYMS